MAADGTIYGVGYNAHGELGDGSTTERHSPVAIGGLGADPRAKLAHGGVSYGHMIVIAPDGTARGMGKNDHTQLGGGLSNPLTTPTPLAALGDGIVDAYRGGLLHRAAQARRVASEGSQPLKFESLSFDLSLSCVSTYDTCMYKSIVFLCTIYIRGNLSSSSIRSRAEFVFTARSGGVRKWR